MVALFIEFQIIVQKSFWLGMYTQSVFGLHRNSHWWWCNHHN